MDKFKTVVSILGGFISCLLGGYDAISHFLLVMILLDIISGFLKAIVSKEISANVMFMGGLKKITMIMVVFASVQIDKTFLVNFILRDVVIIYFIANEGISFIENISTFIDLPEEFTKFFINLKEDDINND